MGSPHDEEVRDDDWEGPQHLVTFDQPFAVGRFAVTVGEFRVFLDDVHHKMPDTSKDGSEGEVVSFYHPGFVQSPRHPVVGVLISDARAYTRSLSHRSGYSYRLLSESEWEYVARAGTQTPFWWGTEISTRLANCACIYWASAGPGSPYAADAQAGGIDRGGTVPVDEFAPNPWGLYNVHGNVSELVEDTFYDNYDDAPCDGTARIAESIWQVSRGGNWGDPPWELRAAARALAERDMRRNGEGFRVARDLR